MHPAVPLIAYASVEAGLLMTGTAQSASSDNPTSWLTTFGPFSAAIGLSYYLLRRSDSREALAEQNHIQREHRLEDQLGECRAALAVARSEIERLKREGEQQ